MKNGLVTSAYNVISKSALVGMGEMVSEDALAWYESHPKTLQASELISRLQDDVMTYQVKFPICHKRIRNEFGSYILKLHEVQH